MPNETLTTHPTSLTTLKHIVREWQLARDRFELPETDPQLHAQREAVLHIWERRLREARV